MKSFRILPVLILVGFCGVRGAGAQEAMREAIPNWAAPPTWTPQASPDPGARAGRGLATIQAVYPALPFVAVTPCRVADTRGNGFAGAYGPPSIAANTTRSFVILGQCGIPASAAAVSFNFAALDVSAAGDLRVFPTGGAVPTVSTLNYNANTPNIANAAIVPLGVGGAITVQADAVTVDLIIDVKLYCADFINSGQTLVQIGSCSFAGSSTGRTTTTAVTRFPACAAESWVRAGTRPASSARRSPPRETPG